jgi:hypothetical protein
MSVGRAREEVGGGRRDDHELGLARESDVIERVPVADEHAVHRTSGERLERDRPDELTCRAREDDVHLGAGLREQRASHADL